MKEFLLSIIQDFGLIVGLHEYTYEKSKCMWDEKSEINIGSWNALCPKIWDLN